MSLIAVILLAVGAYVGWNIGANDAANCIGTMVGAGYMTYRRAAVMMGICVLLGGLLQGQRVMKTVGKGIVIDSQNAYEEYHAEPAPADMARNFPDDRLPDLAVLVALLSAGIFVTAASLVALPVSTSQAIVGGVAGVGLGIVGMRPDYLRIDVLIKILICWVASPFLTACLAFAFYRILSRLLAGRKAYAWSRLIGLLLVASSCYVSYSLGANDVGNAIGPLLNRFPDAGMLLALLGGTAMAVGVLTFGRRVTETVGKSITPLDATGAFAAQFCAGAGVHLFATIGIPVSTSQAIVGAVIGVGLTKGLKAVRTSRIGIIAVGWVVTPACSALCAALLYRILLAILETGGS